MIRQALTNLLQNAADAVAMREDGGSDGAGRIAVTVRDRSGLAFRCSVTDDGIGLPRRTAPG